jgi:predicted dehydrogenase
MPSSNRPRLAVIGAGRMAFSVHLPSQHYLARAGRSELAAICDLNQEAAAKAAKVFGAKAAYHDIDEMLNKEKPDGVVVLTRVVDTACVAGHVLRRGYPVLMEKPPGESSRECRAMIKAAKAGRAKSMVAFNRRFCPVLVQGKAEMRKRAPLKGASALMYRHLRSEDDFFYGTGIHSLDALRFLGGDMNSIETHAKPLVKGERPAFTLVIGYKNGTSGTLVIRPQAGASIERYEIFGHNTVALIRAGVGWLIDAPGTCEIFENNKPVRIADALAPFKRFDKKLKYAAASGFFGENAHFVDALHGKAQFTPSLEESLQSVEIAEAVQAGRNWKRK